MECDAGVVGWRAGCDDVQGLDLAPGVGIGGDVTVYGDFEIEGREASSRIISAVQHFQVEACLVLH